MGHDNYRLVYQGGPDGTGIDIIDTENPRRSQAAVRLVLLVLADIASDTGEPLVWPSLATLSGWTRLDEKTVRRSLRTLQRAGILELTKEASKTKRLTRVYRLNLSRAAESESSDSGSTPGSNSAESGSLPGSSSSIPGSTPSSVNSDISTNPGSLSQEPGSLSQEPGSLSQEPGSLGTPTLRTPQPLEPRRGERGEGEDSSRPEPRVAPLGDSLALAPQGRLETQPRERSASEKKKDIDDFRNFLTFLRGLMKSPLDFDNGNQTNRELVIERLRAGWRLHGLAQKVHSLQEWKGAKNPNSVLKHRLELITVDPDDTELAEIEDEQTKALRASQLRAIITTLREHPIAKPSGADWGVMSTRYLQRLDENTISEDNTIELYAGAEKNLRAKIAQRWKQLEPIVATVPEDDSDSRSKFIEHHHLGRQYGEPLEPGDIPEALNTLERLNRLGLRDLESLGNCAKSFAGWDCLCSEGKQ